MEQHIEEERDHRSGFSVSPSLRLFDLDVAFNAAQLRKCGGYLQKIH